MTSIDEDVNKLETSYIVDEDIKWYSLSGKQFDSFLPVKY